MRASLRRAIVAAISYMLLGQGPVRAQELSPLFELGAEVSDYSSPAAVEEYEISLDLDLIRSPAPVLSLALPGAGVLTAHLSEIERRAGDSLTWTGRLGSAIGTNGRNVVLTLENGLLSGIVFLADRTFLIVPRAGGGHRLATVDPDLFPECSGAEVPPTLGSSASHVHGKTLKLAGSTTVDVLAVYTPAARAAAGGASEIEATIQSAVDVANAAYRNSDIASHLVMIHSEEIAHTEAPDIQTDLNWVAADPGVASLRDTYHADVVALVITGGTSCGIAFVQTDPDPAFESAAFLVTRLDCAFADLSLAHEVAHLHGAEHNPEDSVRWPSNASFPWSFGHYHPGAYRTVMSISTACAPPCPRQPYFSNPNVELGGLPTGLADERENYRTINETAPIVAGFRARPPAIFADGFETGGLAAWSLTCTSAECGI